MTTEVKSMLSDAVKRNTSKFEREVESHNLRSNFLMESEVVSLVRELEDATKDENDNLNWSCFCDDTWDDSIKKHGKIVILHILFYCGDGEESEELRSKVQKVINRPAFREVNSYDGSIKYVFTKTIVGSDLENVGAIRVTLNHGSLAPSCQVVEQVVTRTEFKIVCDDGSESNES